MPITRRTAIRLMAIFVMGLPLLGPWAVYSTPGVSAATGQDSRVLGIATTSGEVTIGRRATWRELLLPAGHARDVDLRFEIATDKLATGRGQSVFLVARRTTRGNEYRARIRFLSDGGVEASVVRLAAGRRQLIGQRVRIAGLKRRTGSFLSVRVRVVGDNPTLVNIKVWPLGMSEPVHWSHSVGDKSPLTAAGSAALRFALPISSTNVPVRYTYDQLKIDATSPTDVPPAPQPSTSPSPVVTSPPSPIVTPTPSPSPSPSPSPIVTPVPSVTPSPTPITTASPTPAPAGAYYVSASGSDSAAGTQSAPWRTLQKAADSVPVGATVLIRAGTYAPFTMRRSGTASAPITFAAYPGERPVVDGNRAVTYTVRLTSVRHVHIDGLTVQGGYAEKHNGGGVLVENSSYVVVRNSLLRDNKAFGVRSAGSTHVLIDSNEITANAVGVHINSAGEGTRVTDNLIYDNTLMMVNTPDIAGDDVGAEAVALVKSTGRVVVSGNLIWGNRAPSYDYGYDGGAFSIYAASNWTITGNITWDNRNVLETGTDANKTPCDNNTFTRNLNYGATTVDRTVGMVLRCGSNMLVANNTFHGLQHWVFAISHNKGTWGGSIEGLRIVNNLISLSTGKVYGLETTMPASVVIDYNLIHNTGPGYVATVYGRGGTTSLATFRSWTGYELYGLAADPRFRDAAANDYRLQADSPAVDSALLLPPVTDAFTGAGPDRGYHELR